MPKTITFYTPEFYALNNFSAHMLEYDGVLYPTAEHAYQATKCLSHDGRQAIAAARSPMEAKHLANEVYSQDKDPNWEGIKVEVMEKLLRQKLAQHEEVRGALKTSGNSLLDEGSPVDYFWGTGADGSGKNILGNLWMKIRQELE